MYYVNEYDYESKKNNIIYGDVSYYNAINAMEDYAHKYIMDKSGVNLKNYEDYVYDYDKEPNRDRQLLTSEYYIKKSKHSLDKITCRRKIKKYGYLYNSYDIINCKMWQISFLKLLPKNYHYYNYDFDQMKFNIIIYELNNIIKRIKLIPEPLEYEIYYYILEKAENNRYNSMESYITDSEEDYSSDNVIYEDNSSDNIIYEDSASNSETI